MLFINMFLGYEEFSLETKNIVLMSQVGYHCGHTFSDGAMEDRKLKLGIAGLGRGFTVMLPTLSLHPKLELVAAVDTRTEACEQFETDFGGTSYDSVGRMCADADIDAVYVLSLIHI